MDKAVNESNKCKLKVTALRLVPKLLYFPGRSSLKQKEAPAERLTPSGIHMILVVG